MTSANLHWITAPSPVRERHQSRQPPPLSNQFKLSLAPRPRVALACMAIRGEDGAAPVRCTSRANLIEVISNGASVLGLGNIGALAAKLVVIGTKSNDISAKVG